MLSRSLSNKKGISFIEILITLLILGVISAFVVPTFLTKNAKTPRKLFCAQFSVLMQESLACAIVSNKIHQIYFDFEGRKIIVKIHEPAQIGTTEHDKFAPIPQGSYPQPIAIPESLDVKNFFINGKDEFASGNTKHTAWFYIMPNGTSQSIILNIHDDESVNQSSFAITINPFYSQVKEYDTFQQP